MAAPWDPLPKEPPGSYNAFLAYCELGPERTLTRLSQLLKRQEADRKPRRGLTLAPDGSPPPSGPANETGTGDGIQTASMRHGSGASREEEEPPPGGASRSNLGKLSQRWNWFERAQAWDAEQARQRLEKRAKEIEEMNERHLRLIQPQLNALTQPVKALLERLKEDPELLKDGPLWGKGGLMDTIINAPRAMETLMKMERLARGVSTENTEVTLGDATTSQAVQEIASLPEAVQLRLLNEILKDAS